MQKIDAVFPAPFKDYPYLPRLDKMTTPAKVYQEVRFDELMSYASKNPNRHRTLAPIEIRKHTVEHEDTGLDAIGLEGYVAVPMDPTGIVSILLCIQNPGEYGLMQMNQRTLLLSELCNQLQTDTDQLKNTSLARSRKKLYELIAKAYQQGPLEEKDHLLLYHGIEHLRQLQFVMLNDAVQEQTTGDKKEEEDTEVCASAADEKKGTVHFSSNPIHWKHDHPVWVADLKGGWLAVPHHDSAQSMESCMIPWLQGMEEKGWTIMWPEVDGTKVELVEKLSRYPSWTEDQRKTLKDVLARRLGKEQALDVFRSWQA